jgi:hypothetical protein
MEEGIATTIAILVLDRGRRQNQKKGEITTKKKSIVRSWNPIMNINITPRRITL